MQSSVRGFSVHDLNGALKLTPGGVTGGTIFARIIQNTTKQSASVASLTTDPISTTTGNSIVSIVTCFGNHIGTFSDSVPNSWATTIASTGNTKGWAAMFHAHAITGNAAQTFTITSSSSNDFFGITVWEVQGLLNATANSTNNNGGGTSSTSHTSGSITAGSGADELFFGGGALSASAELTPTVTTVQFGWSRRGLNATASLQGIIAGVAFAKKNESYSFDYTTSNAQFETALVAGFKVST